MMAKGLTEFRVSYADGITILFEFTTRLVRLTFAQLYSKVERTLNLISIMSPMRALATGRRGKVKSSKDQHGK